jgi:hypothetical protein
MFFNSRPLVLLDLSSRTSKTWNETFTRLCIPSGTHWNSGRWFGSSFLQGSKQKRFTPNLCQCVNKMHSLYQQWRSGTNASVKAAETFLMTWGLEDLRHMILLKQFTLCLKGDHLFRATFSVDTSGLEKPCACEFFMTAWDWKHSIFAYLIVESEDWKNFVFTASSGGTGRSGTKGIWACYHRQRAVVLCVLFTRFIVSRVPRYSSWKN